MDQLVSVGDETHYSSGEQSRRRRCCERRFRETAQPVRARCGRVRTAERANVRDQEQQDEPEGGQYGREQGARRGPSEGARRGLGLDLGGGFEGFEAEEEDGREAEDDKRGGGSHGDTLWRSGFPFGFEGRREGQDWALRGDGWSFMGMISLIRGFHRWRTEGVGAHWLMAANGQWPPAWLISRTPVFFPPSPDSRPGTRDTYSLHTN